ncbi:glutamate mutase L (plasmid) [Rhizobium sullae]|uniref:Glutamate mutase L n=1 Tax=Rhizobium sullae TaxID=50338 RepID=A0ABY5XZB4_RHISU|nr:glutamate mutase L [Rhizobium sullae]UWU19582.1 glutamate mutase L [Rhizobium sullae]
MIVVSIDIGSTWTKGVAFALRPDNGLRLLSQGSHPTTVQDLSIGFETVLHSLVLPGEDYELCYSSSAKGGLAVAAVGLVPELTAEMAKVTACSSGARLTQSFAYELSEEDIDTLKKSAPDIILLSGGSDGGNVFYPARNAEKIAGANIACSVVYAGNRSAREQVAKALQSQDVVYAENVLPTLDTPNPEPARSAIREIFLSKITSGKGLDRIIDRTGSEPCPTPYALYEFCRSLATHAPELGEFVLIDMGGATTDVYSYHEELPVPGIVRRGLPEPTIKRTVEGDLGMRVSAVSALEAAGQMSPLPESDSGALVSYVEKLTSAPEHLAVTPQERRFDALLAGANIATSLMRHAGRAHEVATADGVVTVQTGRDLTSVKTMIGTGGYLSHSADFDPRTHLSEVGIDKFGKRILVSQCKSYLRDPANLLPLLANVSRKHPAAAAIAAVRLLSGDIAANPQPLPKAACAL